MNNIKRKEWLDTVRGIGVILVMLAHSCGIPLVGGVLLASYMPMFFVATGYTYKNKSRVMLLKAKRLLIPYFFYNTVCFLIYVVNGIFTGSLAIDGILVNAIGILYSRYMLYVGTAEENITFLNISNSPLWFLTALFVSFVLFETLQKMHAKWKSVLIACYLLISISLSNLPILLPWSIDTAFLGAIFIEFGCFLSRKNIDGLSSKNRLSIYTCCLLIYLPLVVINGQVNMSIREYGNIPHISVLLFLIIGISGSILYFLTCIAFQGNVISRILARIGTNTITILGIHMIVFEFIDFILPIELNPYLIAIVEIAVVLMLSSTLRYLFNTRFSKFTLAKYI